MIAIAHRQVRVTDRALLRRFDAQTTASCVGASHAVLANGACILLGQSPLEALSLGADRLAACADMPKRTRPIEVHMGGPFAAGAQFRSDVRFTRSGGLQLCQPY